MDLTELDDQDPTERIKLICYNLGRYDGHFFPGMRRISTFIMTPYSGIGPATEIKFADGHMHFCLSSFSDISVPITRTEETPFYEKVSDVNRYP